MQDLLRFKSFYVCCCQLLLPSLTHTRSHSLTHTWMDEERAREGANNMGMCRAHVFVL